MRIDLTSTIDWVSRALHILQIRLVMANHDQPKNKNQYVRAMLASNNKEAKRGKSMSCKHGHCQAICDLCAKEKCGCEYCTVQNVIEN